MQMRTRLFFARNLLKTWSALQIMKQQEKCLELEAKGATLQELMPVISGKLGKAAYADGNVDGGMFAIGPAVGLIHDVESCKEIIDSIMAEAEDGLKRLNSLGL